MADNIFSKIYINTDYACRKQYQRRKFESKEYTATKMKTFFRKGLDLVVFLIKQIVDNAKQAVIAITNTILKRPNLGQRQVGCKKFMVSQILTINNLQYYILI